MFVRLGSDGEFEYRDPGGGGYVPFKPYAADTEYEVRLVVNVESRTVDIWVDGVQEVNDIGYTEDIAGAPRAVLFSRYSGDQPAGTAQFDRVSADIVPSNTAP